MAFKIENSSVVSMTRWIFTHTYARSLTFRLILAHHHARRAKFSFSSVIVFMFFPFIVIVFSMYDL